MECKYCKADCCKAGKQASGLQRYYCKTCKKYQQKEYTYRAYEKGVAEIIPALLCNSVGIRGIGRVLNIAVNTVVQLIKKRASSLPSVQSYHFIGDVSDGLVCWGCGTRRSSLYEHKL